MIDGTKFNISYMDVDRLLENPLLDFKQTSEQSTGELLKSIAEYRYLTITINYKRKTIEIRGSIHKFYKGNNYTDFNYLDFVQAIERLKNDIGIDPPKTILRNLEFGMNIPTDVSPDEVIKNYLEHRRTPFLFMDKGKNNNLVLGKQCKCSRYIIKVYNKSKDYNLPYNLMRFELKVVKMEQLRKHWKIPVHSLDDLLNLDNWYLFRGRLLQYYDDILRVEKVDINALTNKELDTYITCSTTQSLALLRLICKNGARHRNTYGNKLKQYKKLIEQYGIDSQTATIRNRIERKIDILINCANVPLLEIDEKLPSQKDCANVPLSKSTIIAISSR